MQRTSTLNLTCGQLWDHHIVACSFLFDFFRLFSASSSTKLCSQLFHTQNDSALTLPNLQFWRPLLVVDRTHTVLGSESDWVEQTLGSRTTSSTANKITVRCRRNDRSERFNNRFAQYGYSPRDNQQVNYDSLVFWGQSVTASHFVTLYRSVALWLID